MADLLIEIGTEEIPAAYAEPALKSIEEALRSALEAARLSVGEATLLGTPRRLTLHFRDVPAVSESVTLKRQGPAAKIAFDGDGNPTKAGLGFARSQGVDPAGLEVVETDKGPYVAVTVTEEGAPAAEILAEALPRALRSASFPKTMRWTGSEISFARPIRNLVVLHGAEVVPLELAGLTAGRTTPGHPFLEPGPVELETAGLRAYVDALRERKVLVDPAERKEAIRAALAAHLGEGRSPRIHEDLLDEVTWLTEWPLVLEGRIDEEYLELPYEVLETAMRAHLRFFPVLTADGAPEPAFLSVMNREAPSADLVREGNERVLRSRLSDARFFLAEDGKRRLSDFLPELADKSLHRDLGTYREKGDRLVELSGWLAEAMDLGAEAERARRAALLAKADLVTEMVGEFPELQGTVGRIYATRDGEDPAVARAIEDHYRPRGPAEECPEGPVSLIVALAEKLDNLAAFFLVAGAPTGSADPFGLRRQALGMIRIAWERGAVFPLGEGLLRAARLVGTEEPEKLRDEVLAYVRDRLHPFALAAGFRYDLVRAALAAGFDDIRDLRLRLDALDRVSGEDWWPELVEVVERTGNILKGEEPGDAVDESLLEETAEKELFGALTAGEAEIRGLLDAADYEAAARAFADTFAKVVHRFFEEVFVNVDDEALRKNRHALLGRINDLFAARIADLSDVNKEGRGG